MTTEAVLLALQAEGCRELRNGAASGLEGERNWFSAGGSAAQPGRPWFSARESHVRGPVIPRVVFNRLVCAPLFQQQKGTPSRQHRLDSGAGRPQDLGAQLGSLALAPSPRGAQTPALPGNQI